MTDPADRHLADRLHALARGVTVPVVPTDDDVRRGRRRLMRMRLAMAGATTGTLAVVLGITSLTAGDPTAEPPLVDQPSTSLTADPTTTPSEEDGSARRQNGTGDGTKVGRGSDPTQPTGSTGATIPGLPAATDGATGATGGTDPHEGATTSPGHGHSTASQPTSAPTSATPTPTATATATPTSDPTTPPTDTARVRVHQVLRYYNDVLAEHLDPARDHLQPYSRKTGNKETTKVGGKLFALGSTYRWEDGRALAGLEITVASGWDQVEWDCGASYSDWDCHVPAVVAPRAEVATHDGLRQVAVEHADGQVVVLTAASGVDTTESDLVESAADVRLTLPGEAPVSPPQIDEETFASAGVTALVRKGESFSRTSIDRTPEVRGNWSVADAARGTLSWSAQPVYSGAGWQCLTTYRSCSEVQVGFLGQTVHVAAVKKKLGGGWVIGYDGPSYAVRVYASDKGFPKKRAFAFVTGDAWQPAR